MSEMFAELAQIPAELPVAEVPAQAGAEAAALPVIPESEFKIRLEARIASEVLIKARQVGRTVVDFVRHRPEAESVDMPLDAVLDRIKEIDEWATNSDTTMITHDELVCAAMGSETHTPSMTKSVVEALNDLLNHDSSRDPLVWKYLTHMPDSTLLPLFRERFQPLMNILERTAPYMSYDQEFVRLVDRAAAPIYGDIARWKLQTGLPSFMGEIVVGDSYNERCLDVASEKAAGMEGAKQVQYLRDTERIVLYNAGLPENISRDFRLAMQDRTMMKNDKGWTIPVWRGGKVNTADWKTALAKVVTHIDRVGEDVLSELHKHAGMVNFDRYEAEQLEFMDRFLKGDEETMKGLRDTDVVAVMSDVFGDHNNGLQAVPSLYDTKTSTLFFEVARPTDIYRHFIRMRKSGVYPSTLVLSVHGAPGSMVFGEGKHGFSLGTSGIGRRSYSLGRTSARRLAREYMRPGRATDSRSIILASCSQGKAQLCRPTAHVLARRFAPADNVVVSASRHVGYEARDSKAQLRFYSDGEPVDTVEFRSTGRRFGTKRTETQRILGM